MSSTGYNWGDAAKDDLWTYLVSMRDDEAAVGAIVAMVREDGDLKTVPLDLDQMGSVDEVVQHLSEINCELLVVDGGNKHGDSWKAVYHPISNTLSTFAEEIDMRPKPGSPRMG